MADGEKALGALLRKWRTSRQIPMTRLAEQAGVSRMTLNRWEAGQCQPRLPELEAVLGVLEISPGERAQVMARIDAPRAVAQARAQTPQYDSFGEEAGRLPASGDLLRAMRCRRGLSQEQVAHHLRVRQSAISHWEQSRTAPSAERLEALLNLVDAYPEERMILTEGRLLSSPAGDGAPASLEALEALLAVLKAQIERGDNRLLDLRLLTLEAHLWPLARRRATAQFLLMDTYRAHSRWLWWRNRAQESFAYAEQVLKTIPLNAPCAALTEIQIDAVHIQGGLASDRSSATALHSALEQLRRWLPHATRPEEKGLLYRDMADYLGREGRFESALKFSAQACEMAERTQNPEWIALSRFIAANILTQAGRPSEALGLLRTQDLAIPIQNANEALLWSLALVKLNQRSEAACWLNRAYRLLAIHDLPQMQARADALARCL